MSRKSSSFGQLVRYFEKPELKGPSFLHNLISPSSDRTGIVDEFAANARLLPRRKNGNVLYHEILSFSAEDAAEARPEALEALTRHYLELRAPYALAYSTPHLNTDNPHVHLLISANDVGSTRRNRLSKREFRQIQKDVERYQQQHFPRLRHSLAQGPNRRQQAGQFRSSRSEQERNRRGEIQPSHKEVLSAAIQEALVVSSSAGDCYRRLRNQGLRLYKHDKTVGVEDVERSRRYRLQTLGLKESFDRARQQWARSASRLKTLAQQEPSREHHLER